MLEISYCLFNELEHLNYYQSRESVFKIFDVCAFRDQAGGADTVNHPGSLWISPLCCPRGFISASPPPLSPGGHTHLLRVKVGEQEHSARARARARTKAAEA